MIRITPTRPATKQREQLKQDFSRAAPLRDIYPQLAELRVEIEYEDGSDRPPSSVAFAYFPAARGFFRYACPCHSCNGEIDLSDEVALLAGEASRQRRSRRVQVACAGLRLQESSTREPCPICARIQLSATLNSADQST